MYYSSFKFFGLVFYCSVVITACSYCLLTVVSALCVVSSLCGFQPLLFPLSRGFPLVWFSPSVVSTLLFPPSHGFPLSWFPPSVVPTIPWFPLCVVSPLHGFQPLLFPPLCGFHPLLFPLCCSHPCVVSTLCCFHSVVPTIPWFPLCVYSLLFPSCRSYSETHLTSVTVKQEVRLPASF